MLFCGPARQLTLRDLHLLASLPTLHRLWIERGVGPTGELFEEEWEVVADMAQWSMPRLREFVLSYAILDTAFGEACKGFLLG